MAMARRQHRPPAGHWLTCGPEGPHALVPGGRTCTQASASAATAEVSTRMRVGGREGEGERGREGGRELEGGCVCSKRWEEPLSTNVVLGFELGHARPFFPGSEVPARAAPA